MPTYEFRCPSGHEFERFYRKISDAESELPCPECGAVATRQLSAGAGLLFKGSGFYLTDYGKNAHRKAGPAAAKSGDSKSEGKSEGAAKGDAKSSDAKPAESKPAAEKPSTPKSSGSSGGDKS
jgi:putative FmdB family regulatory protein